jgi:phosphocarrier protein HPr
LTHISQDVEIINKLGMHARAAAKFVKLASTFKSKIELERKKQRVNGKSIMGVMMLAASKGTQVTIYAEGNDAKESINQLEQLINNRFDEDE